MNNITIDTITERRQIARTMEFAADVAQYIDWNAIGHTRAELGSDLHVTAHPDGRLTVIFSWRTEEE
jgi:hypothetical protein